MVTLYNKIPYFKKINQKGNKGGKNSKPVTPPKGKAPTSAKDSTKKEQKPSVVLEYVARVIMSLKNVNVTYSINNGTILPGYSHFTNMMGMDPNFAGPTPGFILGDQKDIRQTAIENDWLVKTKSLNVPFVQTSSTNLNIRANIEPIPDLKIEVTGVRTSTTNKNEFFRWKENDTLPDGTLTNHFKSESPMETGNFSMSFLSYGTSFKNGNTTFTNFLNMRSDISSRLGAENDSSMSSINGFAEGYNPTSQDVLIPAFLAAYSGKGPLTAALTAFPKLPKPNWRAT